MIADNMNASPRPWRIDRVSRQGVALVKGADNSIVAVLNVANARLVVDAVNKEAK